MHGFVKRLAPAGLLIGCAERGGRQHAERTRHHRGFVGKNVTEQIVGHDDVELFRVADQLHCAVIGQNVLELDVRSVRLVDFGYDLLPQHACPHDVVLLGGMDLVAALARQIEGNLGDALDFVRGVNLRIDGAAFAIFERHDFLRLAEINATRQLAHDHDVEAFDEFALQARSVGERRIADGRAEIGEKVEVFPEPQQAGFGTVLIGDLIPLRPADGAEHHGIGLLRLRHRRVGDRDAVRVIGRSAHQIAIDLKFDGVALGVEEGDETLNLGNRLDANTVAGKKQKRVRGHGLTVLRRVKRAKSIAGSANVPAAAGQASDGKKAL